MPRHCPVCPVASEDEEAFRTHLREHREEAIRYWNARKEHLTRRARRPRLRQV